MGNKQAKQAKAEEKAAKEVAPKVAAEESTTSAGTDDHAAATKIQAVHRGKGARKSKEEAVAPTGSDDHAAATKIQAVHRGKGARKSKGGDPTPPSSSAAKAPAASDDLEANARTVLAANPENRCVKYLVSLADSGKLSSLSPEVLAQLTKCAKTGLENGDSGLGCYAMAPADYDELNFFFDPVCNDYHNNPVGDKVHTTNWSLKGVEGLPESGVLDMRDLGLSEPLSMRVRVGRNLTSFPLPGAMTKSDRINFENTMLGAFATLVANDSYGGQVYSMTPNAEWKKVTGKSKNPNLISATKYQELVDAHVMFKDMDADPYLKSAGIASDWPCGRGCYQSADGGFIIWFGEEDQLRIMCMGKGFILNEIFDRLNTALQLVESIKGIEFATSSKYGYVTSCPSNLGTGMRASVHLKIPNLTVDGTDTKAKAAAKPLGLSVRGTGGEHTPIGSDGTVDISPSNRLFITEAEIVTKLYNGIKLLMEKESGADSDSFEEKLAKFYAKDEVTICVTDVGLGGLSVLSGIETRLREMPLFPKVKLLYYNSAVKPGYTQRPVAHQVSIFNSALDGMASFKPDIIFIACNTLSVIYADTEFAKTCPIPVMSIVDFGVNLFAEKMLADPTSAALIFGTDTTANVAAHRTALEKRGVAPERVIMKGCPKLATNIQGKGADSSEAEALLEKFVHEAWEVMAVGGTSGGVTADKGLAPVSAVYAGMCCTHYGYSLPLWNKALKNEAAACLGNIDGSVETSCINPNSDMAEFIFTNSTRPVTQTPSEVMIQVLSMVPLVSEIESIAPLLSIPAGDGLRAYENKLDMFDNELIALPEAEWFSAGVQLAPEHPTFDSGTVDLGSEKKKGVDTKKPKLNSNSSSSSSSRSSSSRSSSSSSRPGSRSSKSAGRLASASSPGTQSTASSRAREGNTGNGGANGASPGAKSKAVSGSGPRRSPVPPPAKSKSAGKPARAKSGEKM